MGKSVESLIKVEISNNHCFPLICQASNLILERRKCFGTTGCGSETAD